MVGVRLLQLLLILTILGVIGYLLRLSYALKLEKRIAKFTINSNDKEISFFDKLFNLGVKIIRRFGNIISKSEVLFKYSNK